MTQSRIAAQIQKVATVNEAFSAFDRAICAAVDGYLVNGPPAIPTAGSCHIVGGSPTGAWAGHAFALAGYTAGGWRFIAPIPGLTVFDVTSGEFATYFGGAWDKGHVRGAKLSVGGNQVVGARLAAVADPSAGSVVDTEARTAIAAILARLRQHGLIAS